MSFESERAAIETHFRDGWALSPFSATTVIYENVGTKQPSGAFILHRIADSDGRQIEIAGAGPVLHRYVGLVQVDVLAPVGSGTSVGRQIGDAVSDIYRRRQITDSSNGSITFKTPSLRAMGIASERYRFVVTCPYIRDIKQ